MGFPLFVARRYLFARRKQAIVFVISTISVLGVIVGVAALVVVLALMTGFQDQIQAKILGVNAHLTILSGLSGRPPLSVRHDGGPSGSSLDASSFLALEHHTEMRHSASCPAEPDPRSTR